LSGNALQSVLTSRKKIQQMLEHQEIFALYQPIVTLDGKGIYAHEALSRGAQDGLPTGPLELFDLAVNLGQAIDLSRMMNLVGVESFDGTGRLFLNVHPEELEGKKLVAHLESLRSRAGDLQLVVEVPETAITDPAQLRELRSRLREFDIGLAFDDFGSGRSRLLELFDSPPQYLKFDRSMIAALAEDPAKRRLVEVLVSISKDKDVVTIAEGVETETAALACAEAGFDYAQGFFFYRPGRNAIG
jgi:EAL domain-containing protein (putative c-di-GMP-specific phosphodiesterase class I)